MGQAAAVVGAALLLFVTNPLRASDLQSIRPQQLPQDGAVLAALEDARQVEPFSESFAAEWKFPIARKEVAARLDKDLLALQTAIHAHPDNPELLLLTGLVARYAYNVDVSDSHGTAMEMLGRAEKMNSADFRAAWFRATLECQTREIQRGAEEFLAIENGNPWDQLPVGFWDDYIACATITDMPAHVLRAGDHLSSLHAAESDPVLTLVDVARKRFEPFDAAKDYQPKEVWTAGTLGQDIEFTSTLCGVRLLAHADWRVNQAGWNHGSCIAYFSSGPYQGSTRQLTSSVLLLVLRPSGGETLQDFARKFMKDGPLTPYTPARCPANTCLAYTQDAEGMYGKDGNGHGRLVIFERDEPQYPGLSLESPAKFPEIKGDSPVAFHPEQLRKRIPGKLYYLVLLDAAASIEEPAMKDFDFFLNHLRVD